MYTKSGAKASKHEWAADTDKLGILSYVSAQLFVSIGGTHFSSVACPKLDCATFLHLPATHILFSLAPFDILTQPLPLTTTAFITALGPGPYSLLRNWQQQGSAAAGAVDELRRILKTA
jgi:hypothetical protein